MSNLKRPAQCAVPGIYKIINHLNGFIYVGSSINMLKRCQDHSKHLNKGIHHSAYLQNAVNKYGIKNFEFIPIMYYPANKEALEHWEQWFMDELKPPYNMSPTAGSSKGIKRTPEQRAVISKNSKGRKFSEQARENMRQGQKNRTDKRVGMKVTQEYRDRCKIKNKEQWEKMSPEKRTNCLKALSENNNSNSKLTHCKRGHELTLENCRESALKKGKRSCKICHNLTRRSRRKAKAESEGRVYNPLGLPARKYPEGYLPEYLTDSPAPESLKIKPKNNGLTGKKRSEKAVEQTVKTKAFLHSQGFKTKKQFHDHILALT